VEPGKGMWLTTGDPKNHFLAYLSYVLKNEDYRGEIEEILKNS
jgi:hypothetical protein